jgi:hypothetical protein
VKQRFDKYFVVRYNTIYERAKFNMRSQGAEESIDSFITDLYKLSEHCNYGSLREELIRDRLVVGIRDPRLSEKMQLNRELTLADAMDMARRTAQVQSQSKELHDKTPLKPQETLAVHAKGAKGGRGRDQAQSHHGSSHSYKRAGNPGALAASHQSSKKKCVYCGGQPHGRPQCPARNVVCHNCKSKGHFSKVCLKS